MYNILFGRNPMSTIILGMLNLKQEDVGRFRDTYISNGEIAVYTRNGGGNRDCWNEGKIEGVDCGDRGCYACIITYRLPKHPNYLRDEDDDFDSTYATIWFSIPDKFKELAHRLESGKFDPDERWQQKLAEIGKATPFIGLPAK